MSLYREAGRARRKRRIAVVAASAAVLVVVLVVVLASSGSSGPPSHAHRVASARSAAAEALDGIELLTVEYGQAVRGGRVRAPTGISAAAADVQRGRQALAADRAGIETGY